MLKKSQIPYKAKVGNTVGKCTTVKYEKRQQVIGTTSSFFSFEKSHKFIVSYKPLCLFDLYLRTFWLCFDSNSNTEKSSSAHVVYVVFAWQSLCTTMIAIYDSDGISVTRWTESQIRLVTFFIARTVAVKKSTQLNFWNDLQSHIVHTFLWLLDLVF